MSDKDKSSTPSTVVSGFLSHLIEMRDRLLKAVIVVAVAFFALFPFAKEIYNWLAAPLVNQGQEMLIIGPVAPFLVPMKLTLLVAFLIAIPYLFYQLWSFVAPGLYKHEKRLIYPLLASSIFLFYLGIAFVYYLLLPMMFQIIPSFAPDIAKYSPDIAQYLDFTMMMFIAFGFGFEMPIATILLISTGMTTAKSLKQKRPYVIVGAFIVGMFLTPPDIISQVMLAIPMWLLFELGLILSVFFNARIKEAGKARDDINTADQTPASTAIAADELWEDDKYKYSSGSSQENSIFNDYKEEDSFDTSPPNTDDSSSDTSADDETISKEEKFFMETEEFNELSEEEMDKELDRIEAQEKADKKAKKKAKKQAKKKLKEEKKKKE